jgi:hypothetical protein
VVGIAPEIAEILNDLLIAERRKSGAVAACRPAAILFFSRFEKI